MAGVGAPEEFRSCGLEFLEHFKKIAALKDGERILDMGCGPGRMAIPITETFPRTSYDGFDVSKPCIDWCRSSISTSHPDFRFEWADVRNGTYHAGGSQDPSTFRFPYPDDTFDLVIMISVITHLPIAATRNYLIETGRVLKPGGRLFATAFLMDERSVENVQAGRSTLKFVRYQPSFWTVNPGCPEDAGAFEPGLLDQLFDDAKLFLPDGIRRGKWDGGPGLTGHDLILAKKSW